MKTKESARKDVECVDPRSSLKEAALLMSAAGVASIPVVEEGRVVGTVTDRDILARTVAAGINPVEVTVGEIMTPRAVPFCPEDLETPISILVKSEQAAVRTYRLALDTLDSNAAARDLRRIRRDHEEAVRLLLEGTDEPDGGAAMSGLWLTFAEALEGAARRFGDTAVLKALKSGEELEIRDYHKALDDERVSAKVKDVICETLLPRAWSHVSTLERRLQPESAK
jgi:CBS domain-containing protein